MSDPTNWVGPNLAHKLFMKYSDQELPFTNQVGAVALLG
jgi:hypothetical protein